MDSGDLNIILIKVNQELKYIDHKIVLNSQVTKKYEIEANQFKAILKK